MLIIGGVLLVAIIGGWYMFSTAKSSGNSNSNANAGNKANTAKTPAPPPVNAPAGANPPNQAGSPAAAVTVEEFADFQCPQCGNVHPIMNEIKSIYGSRIHFIFRNFPLQIPAHDKSYDAAVAAEAAGMQGKFWDMQNLLFSNQKAWTDNPGFKDMWKGYAQKIGLDINKWENDMAGLGAKGRVDADMARGKGMNVNSTPSVYVNGTSVGLADLNVDGLKKVIDAELAKTGPAKDAAPAANTANTANTTK